MDELIVKRIYENVFLQIQHSNIDLFLCGGASNKKYVSSREQLRSRLEKDKNFQFLSRRYVYGTFKQKKI